MDPPGHRRSARPRRRAWFGCPPRSPSLRTALRHAAGDEADLNAEHARLYRLTTPTSLDHPIDDHDGRRESVDSLADRGPTPEQMLVDRKDQATVTDLMGVLDPGPRRAVERRFGLTHGRLRSHRQVGAARGATAQAARRLVEWAIHTMRDAAASRSTAPDLVPRHRRR